ncbi:OmpA family protein [Ferruginibacter sp. SUN106]|uniref:OmpA family protein n=1 Tax=Ferruginibacter sp. SUN106 TaxID=2978348 RepID=UPI003D363042
MKPQFILLAAVLICAEANAQTIGKRVKDRAATNANNKVDQKVDNAVDSAFNKTGNAINNIFKKKDKSKTDKTTEGNSTATDKSATSSGNSNTNSSTSGTNGGTKNSLNSFLDFVPGNNVIFEDDFSKDALGDFPAKWNTNGSGKIVTIDGQQGRWLEVVHNSIINPVMDKALPENCTIQFDLFLQSDGQHTTPFIQFGLTNVRDILKEDMFYKDRFFMNINRYTEVDGKTVEYGLKNDVVGNKSDFPITSYANKVLHVAMSVNKTRIRIYLDEKKLIDLPRALTPEMRNNFFLNNNYIIPASELGMLVGNVRIASADVDARSLLIKQLMEEGRAVTNDILFDVNSDVIKSESFALINQFGDAMKNNPSLKIKITGHTDSDGNAAANTELSKKRAAAVKKYLATNYGITDDRIQTDGKGAMQPVADNSTASGKAKNRRVEFVKL